ncbi:MAG: LLM class flavin-dependent oxidoreductase [Candidatus Caldarchaeum sp.]|nr:LLM class flavin-dependent oxidoreductase [Candidatus Caldarchaeum sp.]
MGYDPSMTVAEMAGWARKVEEKGFDMVFFSETLQTFRDAVTALTAFAQSTEKILLGFTQIVRLRSPLVLAQTFATLDEFSHGRIVVSLGACTNQHMQKHGLPYADPAETLIEYIKTVKQLLTGEKISFEGKHIRLVESGLGFKPIRHSIPIWVAATSRTGLRIAGKYADGVLLNATTSVEYCRNAVKIVRQAAEEIGRDPGQLTVAALVVAAVDDEKRAVDYVRREVASKFSPLMVDFAMRPRLKVGEPSVSDELIQELLRSYRSGGFEKLMQDIPETVLENLTAVGTPSEVRDRIEKYREAGVELPIIRPAAREIYDKVLAAVV